MTENLIFAILVVAGLVALVRFARRDTFAGPGLRAEPHDELGYRYSPLVHRREMTSHPRMRQRNLPTS